MKDIFSKVCIPLIDYSNLVQSDLNPTCGLIKTHVLYVLIALVNGAK